MEDKSSRPKTIHYALSKAECRIIVKVRKRGLFSLDSGIESIIFRDKTDLKLLLKNLEKKL